jgi:cytochrome c-type biogenesis protein CcmH/NrfG
MKRRRKRSIHSVPNVYFADGKYVGAVMAYQNTLQLDPDDAHVHYRLGLARLRQAFRAVHKSAQ